MQKRTFMKKLRKFFLFFTIIVPLSLTCISCASESREKSSPPEEKTLEKPSIPISFALGESQAVAPDKLVESHSSTIATIEEEETKKISELIKNYYEVAFLKPALWEDGNLSILDSFFATEIQNRVREKDFDNLCLADDSKKLDYLGTLDAKIPTILIDIDEDLKPQLCAATTEVEACFMQKDGKTAYFTSSAIFFLELTHDDQWQIFDYDLEYELDSGAASK